MQEEKKLKLLDKYILSQVVKATLACILLFVVIWIAPETLLKVIKRTLLLKSFLSLIGFCSLLRQSSILICTRHILFIARTKLTVILRTTRQAITVTVVS